MTSQIEFIKVDPNACLPSRGTSMSAGVDLYALEDCVVYPLTICAKVRTGVSCNIPYGYYGRVAGRSSLALTYGSQVLGGVIDYDYKGEIIVLMCVRSTFYIKKGARIAQLLIEPVNMAPVVELVTRVQDNSIHAGFGSTGQ
jgi:dUTP pyrophosphatase